jgi:curved DNA-binding protein CbpA
MESTPPSEPPAQAVVREALLLDLSQKLLGVDELYALLESATYYRLLNVATSASSAQIREAYFNSVRCFHPYTFVLAAADERRGKVSAVFEALTRAYETLRRPGTRASYDDAIALPAAERHGTTPAVTMISAEVAVVASVPPAASPRSVRPAAPRPSSPRLSAMTHRSLKPSAAPRPMMLESHGTRTLPRERASAAARAERDFVVEDGAVSGRSAHLPGQRRSFAPEPGTGGTRNPFDAEGSAEEAVRRSSTLLRELDKLAQERLRAEEEACPTILEIANQVRGGGAMSNWAAGRLRDAHHAEQSGQLLDAANILKSVHSQLRDPNVQAHAQRIARLIGEKG